MELRKNLNGFASKAQQSTWDRNINIQLFATPSQNAERLRTLQAELTNEVQKGHTMAADDKTPLAQLNAQQETINRIRAQIQLLSNETGGAAAGAAAAAGVGAQDSEKKDKPLDGGLKNMLKSSEYARAFAKAIRQGITPGSFASRGDDSTRVLMDALTTAGGSPAGEDGGFLVPEDVDQQIRELSRALNPISEHFTVETVTAPTGWRVRDAAPTAGFTELDSEMPSAGIPMDDQPLFVKVPYSTKNYGLILPVSRELMADAAPVANLFAYISRWFARKGVIHDNKLLLTLIKTLTPSSIIPNVGLDAVSHIKQVLNKVLDPMISLGAIVLTNQDGYDYLDQLKDSTGRPLMVPDPANAAIDKIKQRRVVQLPNTTLASRVVNTGGGSDGTYFPLFIGNMKEFGTLFKRAGLEVASTDIGGDAWRKNSIEVRGIVREDTATFDTEAVAFREVFIAE